ncbi:hypothetical protein [Nannocystis punicea]|uniref:Outer membrane lipoprotein BamD-like domain-containing protein n=1 Tax=Nannocystis punicea TaxID=2995304 RepID=A0ABY7GX62_9BACT|nr:hypothetical protein [Nannocystis poenicansa]WAS91575.1 hypothetical protein O0S08_35795 [Nannocystis poenicansa]
MTDEPTSSRALIAAYKACARPSAAAEAQLWASLAAAERAASPRPRRRSPSLAPWLAVAAALLLLAAWQLDLAGNFVSGHVLKDMREQAEYDAAGPGSRAATARDESAGAADDAATSATAGAPGQVLHPSPTGPRPLVVVPPRPRPAAPKTAGPRRGSQAPASEREAVEEDAAVVDDGDRMLAEMALLQEARAALRAGQPAAALDLLDRHAASFAGGGLAEERQALRVQALCAAGDPARGASEAAAFLRAYPRSTYAARVADACPKEHAQKDTSKIP